MIKQCQKCDKDFVTYPAKIKLGKGKYCSRKCSNPERVYRKCQICDKDFFIHNFRKDDKERGKYCSMPCYRKSRKGKPAWNKGLPAPWAIGNKHRVGKGNPNPHKMFEEDNHKWKGDDVGYFGLHQWVRRHLGKPERCELCGLDGLTSHKIHWANKSHKYLRDKKDWIRLCVKCHKAYDSGKTNI